MEGSRSKIQRKVAVYFVSTGNRRQIHISSRLEKNHNLLTFMQESHFCHMEQESLISQSLSHPSVTRHTHFLHQFMAPSSPPPILVISLSPYLCSTSDQTQNLSHARQMLYHSLGICWLSSGYTMCCKYPL